MKVVLIKENDTKDKLTVKCCNCDFVGTESDLEIIEDGLCNNSFDIEYINACPNCGTDEYLSDLK